MKFHNALVGAAIALSISTSAHATPIQIDFIGTVTSRLDALGNVLTGGVAVGDVATGRFIFDDSIIESYGHLSEYEGFYYSNAPLESWLFGSITVNGTTYATNTVPDFGFTPDVERSDDNIRINTFPGDSATITDGYVKDYWVGNEHYFAGNSLQISGGDATGLTLTGADLSDLTSFASLFRNFWYTDVFTKDVAYGATTYIRAGGIEGSINSVTVSRLDAPSTTVPEPSSIALLAAGLLGIAATRKRRHQ